MTKFVKKNYVLICLAVCFLCLLWRAFKGFCWTDESFYVSTADRFYRGVIPLVGEWFRTQMSSIVMVPFYAVYMAVTGSNAGVILYFRILYLILSAAVALVYYRVLGKEYPEPVAGGAALFIMCYAHLNNATFSYYMLSVVLMELALILIYDYKNTKSRIRLVIAGVVLALSVLCMPAFVIGYVPLMAAAVIVYIIKRNETLRDIIIWSLTGTLIPAVIFAVYLFSHVDVDYLLNILPKILVDHEHNETLGYFIRKPNRCLTDVFGKFTYVSYALIAVSFVFQKYLKKPPYNKIVIAVDTVLFAIMANYSLGHTGYIHVAFFMFAVPAFFISEKKNHRLFWLTVIPAGLIALIYCFTSSDFLYVIALGLSVGIPACLCAAYDMLRGEGDGDKSKNLSGIARKAVIIVCTACLCITVGLRFTNVYRDAPIVKLTKVIPSGIAKGLYTTDEHLQQYLDVYDVLEKYCADTANTELVSGNPNGNVLFSKILPWGYLGSRLDCGFPSTWRTTAYDDDQLDLYYKINKTSVPDVIIVLDSRYGSYDAAGDVEDDHEPNLDEMSEYWKDYIIDNGFTEEKVKCGKVYRRQKMAGKGE